MSRIAVTFELDHREVVHPSDLVSVRERRGIDGLAHGAFAARTDRSVTPPSIVPSAGAPGDMRAKNCHAPGQMQRLDATFAA